MHFLTFAGGFFKLCKIPVDCEHHNPIKCDNTIKYLAIELGGYRGKSSSISMHLDRKKLIYGKCVCQVNLK